MSTIQRKWYKVSAKDAVLGRLATQAAVILMGKNRPDYAPHEDKGDFLIITDAEQVKVTGNKAAQKTYFRPSRYPGNSKTIEYERMMKKDPRHIIEHAVKGMLPKNRLADKRIRRLKVYAGSEHPNAAQNPIDLEL